MQAWLKRHSKKIIAFMLISMALYGVGRLYFQVTGGFLISNITADLTHEPDHHLPIHDPDAIQKILKQPFKYLGKGCQSYVFKSQDGKYVLKFLKYQRFRTPTYLDWLDFIPPVSAYKEKKALKKREKLDALLSSWKLAYTYLPEETGIVYVHLNQTHFFNEPIHIIDKMGVAHDVPTNDVVFLLQRNANMLCKTLNSAMKEGHIEQAHQILQNLISMLVAEYEEGLGDNDHALMQNTGVIGLKPIHIDVGQFSQEERFKTPAIYKSEIFSKTYKFRIWLSKHYPELEQYLTNMLTDLIGPEIQTMKPKLKTIDEGA